VLRIAAGEGRILVSHDRRTMPGRLVHFLIERTSPGVILVSQEVDIGTVVEDLLVVWAASDASEWANRLSFLPL
jgi:hypothetical protein